MTHCLLEWVQTSMQRLWPGSCCLCPSFLCWILSHWTGWYLLPACKHMGHDQTTSPLWKCSVQPAQPDNLQPNHLLFINYSQEDNWLSQWVSLASKHTFLWEIWKGGGYITCCSCGYRGTKSWSFIFPRKTYQKREGSEKSMMRLQFLLLRPRNLQRLGISRPHRKHACQECDSKEPWCNHPASGFSGAHHFP